MQARQAKMIRHFVHTVGRIALQSTRKAVPLSRHQHSTEKRFMNNHHDHDHEHEVATRDLSPEELAAEQEDIARNIGRELTEAFVGYVHGEIDFEDLTFGLFDAMSDLSVVASGEYELETLEDDEADEA